MEIKEKIEKAKSGPDGKRVCELMSTIFCYGILVSETPEEKELDRLLSKYGVEPVTEKEVNKLLGVRRVWCGI